jgi:hypothetical protein
LESTFLKCTAIGTFRTNFNSEITNL